MQTICTVESWRSFHSRKSFILEKQEEIDLQEILNTPDDSPVGHVLEVDLHYPDHLHDFHADYPLAPKKKKKLIITGWGSIRLVCWKRQALPRKTKN